MFNDKLNAAQYEIKRWIDKLDQVAIAKEAVWGIGNLLEFISQETADKVRRQDQKLADAIKRQDIAAVQELVNGYIRAYDVMENEARLRGHAPIFPEAMEVALPSGFRLRVAKNANEARSVTEEGVYVWSLQEIAHVIESECTLVNKIKDTFPEAQVTAIERKKFESDELPW